AAGRRVALATFTQGSRDRLAAVLREHGLDAMAAVDSWQDAMALPPALVALIVVGLEKGFATPDMAVIAEQDVLGDRLVRPRRSRVRPEDVIADASSLLEGDLVVHADHGIGRFDGLETISVLGAPHDCLRLIYDGGDKLYLPVENIELIGRYGSETAGVQLDKLGGAAWQARKARMKQRIREMAAELIQVAAARALRQAAPLPPPEGLFDEFCARFPYTETDDQRRAIEETIEDLASGKPTDRLVCGDVGFGKTEVALRAAFVAALGGRQVAVVVPTTLLCRQHFKTFRERFRDLPVRIEQLSRLVSAKQAKEIKRGLEEGTVEIVIGTHALLAGDLRFKDLGLLIVDEEQHFGVAHKEKLKKLKSDVHVVTLSATPIPRTLQLAMSGVREMSIIATPPVDRLAVRTYVMPFDPVVIREAVLRERYRGGQTFYVCPRIEDLDGVAAQIKGLVPEVKVELMHGRMPVREIEDKIAAFADGGFDVLLSTNIIESGLDMPAVNTIVIHRADMFGLGQLYQLRGRVGRSKQRAYAYLTLPPRQKLSKAAERRLEVMQTLDTLGAGFTLASHDLDIRGAGNLLGEEQSGHIREVGIELYQQMLEDAVREAREHGQGGIMEEDWSPQIGVGMPVLIPDGYVADLAVRLDLYRRIARLADPADIESFAAEMIDRFGPLPSEAENLLKTVAVKQLCRRAGVEKVEAGPKGAVVAFRHNSFANPGGLVAWLQGQAGTAKLRPDHKLVLMRNWETPAERMAGIHRLLGDLAALCATKSP
ncbi:MAG: transcription-repair coupling factor, partial [Magnetospirillum sp. WYHS-4]